MLACSSDPLVSLRAKIKDQPDNLKGMLGNIDLMKNSLNM